MVDGGGELVSKKVFTWHDDVHEYAEHARLQFWRFSFVPDYDRAKIFRAMRGVFEQSNITSYILYEALGEYDVIARLWVPKDINPEDLALVFESDLDALSLYQHQYLLVQSTKLHWVWQEYGSGLEEKMRPNPELVAGLTTRQVEEISRFNAQTMEVLDDDESPPLPEPEWLEHASSANLIRALSLDKHGVRFYVTFDHPRRYMRRPERDFLAREIAERCEAVAARTKERLGADAESLQLSVYAGTGPMTDFLVMARAPDSHFYSFARELVFGLHGLELHRRHGMRTYTSVFADRHFAEYVEAPLSRRLLTGPEILVEPESEELEFKATFSRDLRKWLQEDKWEPADFVLDSAIKAVCGLLNAPRPGRLVIGVLELERELERAKDRDGMFRKLLSAYPSIPTGLRPNDRDPSSKVIIGIDEEFRDWDEFVRRFNDIVRQRIEPNPLPYIDLQSISIEGRRLAIVVCRPSPFWFYAQTKGKGPEFFVRELAATRSYSGTAQDLYRRANPRQGMLS